MARDKINTDTWIFWEHVKSYSQGRKNRRKARFLRKFLRAERRYQPSGFCPIGKRFERAG